MTIRCLLLCLFIVLTAMPVAWAGEANLAERPAPTSVSDAHGAFQKSLHYAVYSEVLFPGLREYLEEHAPPISGMNATIEPRIGAFSFSRMAKRVLDAFYIPGGKPEGARYRNYSMHDFEGRREPLELCIVGNFVEVFLAREGHSNPTTLKILLRL